MRRWLPPITLVWALAASVAVLQPCREAFAAGLPHSHGVQVASDAHPHRHTGMASGHHRAGGDTCHCAELAPPFTATTFGDSVLPVVPAPAVAPRAAVTFPQRAQSPTTDTGPTPASGPPAYLTTNRLRI